MPFEIPESWVWTSIGELFEHNTGKALNASNRDGKMMDYITTSNLYWDRFDLSVVKQMLFTEEELWRCTAKKGDLLICEGGDIGRAAIWNYDYDIRIQNHIHRLRGYKGINHRFYYFVFLLYKLSNRIGGKGVAIQGLSSGDLHKLEVPLPPEYEQIRLVKTIEKWFKFVDLLEQEQENLHTLVPSTKSKILDLAISGKLVSQDPNDEPAIELLKRINPAFKPCDNSHYENLPQGWVVCRLEDVCQICDNQRQPINSTERQERKKRAQTLYPYYGATGQVDWIDDYMLDGNFVLLGEDGAPFLDKFADKAYVVSGKIWVNNHAHILKPNCDITYLTYYLNRYDYSECVNGSTRLKLTQADMKNMTIVLPPLVEQHRIAGRIENIFRMLDAITAEL